MKYLTFTRSIAALTVFTLCVVCSAVQSVAEASTSSYIRPIFAKAAPCDITKDSDCKDPALDCDPGSGGDCDLYIKYINPIIEVLTAIVGIAVTIGIVWGGIKYASAGSDPSAVAKARNIIRNAIFTLLIYLFLWQIINWLQPGGL